ncbi:MAG TPA: TatD family hydrolase [Chitinophagaceae bacterium]|nr:TatD family hydrolase [Chitinophagaceae bacterium]
MKIIDTHCHLYLEEYKKDIDALIRRANELGVIKFYMPGIDKEVIDDMLLLEKKYPGECIAMMGLHPCSVKENYKEELKIIEDWLHKRKFAAIGEIGLDFYWDKTFTKQQFAAFKLQMQWALDRSIPIVIHSRNAMQETVDTVKPFAKKGLRGIFHCFGGTEEEAKQIADLGFYLGIGGVVTYKTSGLAKLIEKIGLKNVVLETDSPYLSPIPFKGKRNESSYLLYIIEKIAEATKLSLEEVAAITTANAEKVFGK